MKILFGESILNLKYYWLQELELNGIPLVVSRTGWSSELGYEIYLRDGSKGDQLWEIIMAAGKNFNLQPGHTSSIRRIEGGMLSYHADADINTNPYELGLDRLVNIEMKNNFIGKNALIKISKEGIKRKQIGIKINCEPLQGPNTTFWPITINEKQVGKVTSAIYSPRLEKNIALAMILLEYSNMGGIIDIKTSKGKFKAEIVEKPFYDPKKKITKT